MNHIFDDFILGSDQVAFRILIGSKDEQLSTRPMLNVFEEWLDVIRDRSRVPESQAD